MSRFPAEAFRRYDETPDEELYKTPRLVTHINAPNYKTARTVVSCSVRRRSP
jgi:hypothetical protein